MATKPEQSSTKLAAVTARNPSAKKSYLCMVHLPIQNASLLAAQSSKTPRTLHSQKNSARSRQLEFD
jgi:hypothetical protein